MPKLCRWLEGRAVPLSVLEQRMDEWIAKKKG